MLFQFCYEMLFTRAHKKNNKNYIYYFSIHLILSPLDNI